jgi:hypothetical protein
VVAPGPPPAGGGGSVEVGRFEPRHLPALTDFYRDIWDPAATVESVARARAEEAKHNPVAPGSEVPTFLFCQAGVVLGHLSTIPVQLWTGAAQRPAYWFIGFMVRPEHRNGPIGALLLREAVKQLELTLSLTVAQPSVRLFRATGFQELGLVPNYIRVLRAGNVLRRLDLEAVGLTTLPKAMRAAVTLAQRPPLAALAGTAAQIALGALAGVRSLAARGAVTPVSPERAGLDRLWEESRGSMGLLAARDGFYLERRYRKEAGPYHAVTLRHEGRVQGTAYIREPRADSDPRLKGIRVATLSDVLFPPNRPELGLRLFRGAERRAHELGADALLVSVSHKSLPALLKRRGYVKAGGNLRFLVRDGKKELPGATVLDDWWVSRGDMNADSVF